MTVVLIAVVAVVSNGAQRAAAKSFTVEQIKSYPFPTELTAAATGSRIAWALNERGLRNVWVAEGPDFRPRRLTNYNTDDGQELSSLSISADGKYVVYVRGGDHGANFDVSVGVNPTESPASVKVQIFSIPFAGGEPKLLADGDEPVVSPKSERVVFVKERGLWVVPVDGSGVRSGVGKFLFQQLCPGPCNHYRFLPPFPNVADQHLFLFIQRSGRRKLLEMRLRVCFRNVTLRLLHMGNRPQGNRRNGIRNRRS